MYKIGTNAYESPVMSFAASSRDRAQMCLDAISYRMPFRAGGATERLDDLHTAEDGTHFFTHPCTQGPVTQDDDGNSIPDADWLEPILDGVTSYTVKERPVVVSTVP